MKFSILLVQFLSSRQKVIREHPISAMLYDILWLLIDQTLSHMSDDNDPFSYFRIDNKFIYKSPPTVLALFLF